MVTTTPFKSTDTPLTLESASITQHGTGDALYVQSTDYVNNVNGILTLGGNVELHENTNATGPTNVMDIRGTSLASLSGHVLLDTSGIAGGDGGNLNLSLNAGVITFGTTGNSLAIDARGSSAGGNAGSVTVGNGGSLEISLGNGDAILASAQTGDGKGGTISLNTDKLTLPTSSNAVLTANGSGSEKGGTINISTQSSTIAVGSSNASVRLEARSPDDGDGGTVSLTSATDINAAGASIDVSAGPGSSGTGGNISISSQGAITVTGDLIASGGCNDGNGGTIVIDGDDAQVGSIYVDAGDSASCPAFAAKATHSRIKKRVDHQVVAGVYTFGTSGQPKVWNPDPTKGISAKAANGVGGEVIIHNSNNVDLTAFPDSYIIAKGVGDTGGKVTIDQVNPGALDVNKIIKVDGSDALLAAAENDFGRISLNGEICQQRTTGQNSWPKTYWNCQHPDESTSADIRLYTTGAFKLHAATKTALGIAKIQLYIMRDSNAFEAYHGVGPASPLGHQGYSYEGLRVSAAFFQMIVNSSAATSNSSALYSGTIIHEMAHQLNYWSWGHEDHSVTWHGHMSVATDVFDAPGLPPPATNNCSTVVDADRIDPLIGARDAICSKFDGVTNNPSTNSPYPFKKNSVGLSVEGGEAWFLSDEERFANAFAASYRRLYPTDVIVDKYTTAIEERLTDEHTYMDNIRDNGAP